MVKYNFVHMMYSRILDMETVEQQTDYLNFHSQNQPLPFDFQLVLHTNHEDSR